MVHAIRMLKCKNGHSLPISFDSNECGCHHNGKPCIMITCRQCFEEMMKDSPGEFIPEKFDFDEIIIPLDEDGMEEINKLLK